MGSNILHTNSRQCVRERFDDSLKIEIHEGFVKNTIHAFLGGNSYFSHTNPPFEIDRLFNFNILFQLLLTKFFKSEPFSRFTENLSRD